MIVIALGPTSGAFAVDLQTVVDRTIEHSPAIIGERLAVDSARGGLQATGGTFDPTLQIGASLGQQETPSPASNNISEFETDSANASFGMTQVLSNGIELTPEIILQRERTTAQRLSGLEAEARAITRFSIRFPLLRGGGKVAVLADSDIATLALEASQAQYLRALTTTLGSSISAYWQYSHATQALKIAEANETRAERLENQIRRLVDAGEAPAAQLALVEASTADRRATTIEAQARQLAAESSLALAMGLELSSNNRFGVPQETLPTASERLLRIASQSREGVEGMLARREDLQAARLNEQSATRRLEAIRSDLQPNLDLSLQVEIAGLEEDNGYLRPIDAFVGQDTGPSAQLNLEYRFPIGQSAARGQIASQSATRDQATLRVRALRERIVTETLELSGRLRSTHARLAQVEQAERLYEQSVGNERLNYSAGMSTLINLIEVEDRYASARLSTLNTRLEHALALTEFLVGAALLVEPSTSDDDVTMNYTVRLDALEM